MKNVHTEHCCVLHGCKYGDDDCPVVNGEQIQSFDCEDCEEDPRVETYNNISYLRELGMEENSVRFNILSTDKSFISDLTNFINTYKLKLATTTITAHVKYQEE